MNGFYAPFYKEFEKRFPEIVESLHIEKKEDGFRIFSIPTQHFEVKELSELTFERFEKEIKGQNLSERLQSNIMRAIYGENIDG